MNRKILQGKHRQRGSMGGILVILLALASVVSVGSRVIPLYLDHNTMGTIMEKMSLENGLALQSEGNIRDTMRKRLKMNNIRDFDLKEHLKIDRSKLGTELVLDYEVRIELVSNLSLIAAFNKKVPLRD
ncbi:MAG: DUF4845 domain-containing protein [Gammaproteobacteria bacterium]|nr:DUF4845 domain-containing protein [Gammaproteobacteria bacterium]MBT3868156.1 DUF4845 domain-containing protein [Gammaproteobacteria bacterium]MBT4380546.1 DUF4845 domain-containing protein [Gammaproteobacteria bacterium]MBT4618557.1 DUF4845 domain-containing protein [Gammaproteobacteria bacterium]MBT5197670.1 DUF4845 domain-containing protein [Gammaproteobacteria bacterium]